jgi:hypothetical protein
LQVIADLQLFADLVHLLVFTRVTPGLVHIVRLLYLLKRIRGTALLPGKIKGARKNGKGNKVPPLAVLRGRVVATWWSSAMRFDLDDRANLPNRAALPLGSR